MSLTAKQIQNVKALFQGKTIAWSSLNNNLRQLLIDEELLIIKQHRSHKSIYAHNTIGLKLFLEQNYDELRGIDWNNDTISAASTRAELASVSGNSKTITIRSCPGFLVNCYDPIPAKLGDKDIIISPLEGTMMFISDWKEFTISEDVIVVGVENMENFRMIRHQRKLFESKIGNHLLLFASRYPQSTDLRSWLQRIPNKYVHFGDFDLAGMHIYESEFYKFIGDRASFFIPNDIEKHLLLGSSERYNIQFTKFQKYQPTDDRLSPLCKLIHKYRRCYDQEGYIISNEYEAD